MRDFIPFFTVPARGAVDSPSLEPLKRRLHLALGDAVQGLERQCCCRLGLDDLKGLSQP